MSKEGTLHLVYQRQYYDDEDHDYFFINYTIFRNVPLSQLKRLNSETFKNKIKKYCDKVYDEVKDFKGKFILIGHSIGALWIYYFSKK